MKNLLFSLFLFSGLLLFSCNKNTENQASQYNRSILGRTMRVLSTVADSELVQAYLALSPTEQKTIWLVHIDSLVFKNSYSSSEMTYIDSLRGFISGYDFSTIGDSALKAFFDNWYSGAQNQLSSNDIYLLCFTLCDDMNNEQNRLAPPPGGNNPLPVDDCNCRVDNFFACMTDKDKCHDDALCHTGKGCGLLWLQTCNGICSFF